MQLVKFYTVFIFVLSCTLFSCSSSDNAPEIQENVNLEAEVQLNVSYGENPQQVYDIYLPEGRTSAKTKVLILVHGGGWTEGDKADMDGYVDLLQRDHPNHAIVNINYVLAALPATPAFPNQFLDLKTVIEKLTSETATLHIKPQFGLVGISAGAHISLMYDYVYDAEDKVKFVCDIVGPSDFTDVFYANNPSWQLLFNLLIDENAYQDEPNILEAVSPALQVTGNSSPTLLFYGNQDPLVPLTNGELLSDNLSSAGITNSFTVYDGGHGDWAPASYLNLQSQLNDYINTYLEIEQ